MDDAHHRYLENVIKKLEAENKELEKKLLIEKKFNTSLADASIYWQSENKKLEVEIKGYREAIKLAILNTNCNATSLLISAGNLLLRKALEKHRSNTA